MVRNGPSSVLTPSEQEPAPAIVREEGPAATGERLRPYALAALTALLLALCAALAYPFLPAITWAAALAVIAWPLHAWVRGHVFGNRTAAALLATLVVAALIVVPGALVVRQLGREAVSAAEGAGRAEVTNTIRERVAAVPGGADALAWAERSGVDFEAELRKGVQSFFGEPVALARGWLMGVFQFALALFILFFLLRDRAELLAAVRRRLPVRDAEADRLFAGAAGSVHANLYAALVTSAIDAVTGGLVFWAVGLPSPVTWATVMFVLSLLPVAGIFLVWVPAAVYLGLSDQWGAAAAVVAWGAAATVVVDTLLYTRLAGDRMRLHPVPALLAFVGGLALFGASGMVLGPAALAVTAAVLQVWHARAEHPDAATAPAAG